jgi:hypothetical protein
MNPPSNSAGIPTSVSAGTPGVPTGTPAGIRSRIPARIPAGRQRRLLRIAYWYGAAVDMLSLPPMLSAKIAGLTFGIDGFAPGREYHYAMYVGAALMAGWTVLLLWADRQPLQRRGVLPITIVPVAAGIYGSTLYAGHSGLCSVARLTPMLVGPVLLAVLYLFTYWYTSPRRAAGVPS